VIIVVAFIIKVLYVIALINKLIFIRVWCYIQLFSNTGNCHGQRYGRDLLLNFNFTRKL